MKSSHGGKRAGAGRKASPDTSKIIITARISPELARALRDYHTRTGGTFSAAVEYFIQRGMDTP